MLLLSLALAACGGASYENSTNLLGEWDCEGTQQAVQYSTSLGTVSISEHPFLREDDADVSICSDPVDVSGDPEGRMTITTNRCELSGVSFDVNEGWFQLDDEESMHGEYNTDASQVTYRTEFTCVRAD